jgi:hypothetical protein
VIVRRGVVLLAAILLAVVIVRNAAVDQFAEFAPETAVLFWPGHPAAELSSAMTNIGRSARVGRSVGGDVFAKIDEAATKAPLAPEPFLVQGVRAQLAANGPAAVQAFTAAQRRDPRSMPAAYFLADHFFHANRPIEGLKQIAVLARLSPAGIQALAPYVAAYAQDRANWPQIRQLFQSEPTIEEPVLVALATNAATVDTVLALAGPGDRSATSQWLPTALRTLADAGQYARARSIWAQFSGAQVGPGTLLYDTGFADATPPPPFNWALTSSTVGVAERQRGGRLHVLFYSQEDGVLASQLLVLPPGSYRLTMNLSGDLQHASSVLWSIRCDKASTALGEVTLDVAAARGWNFQVPAGCAAQWLELSGRSTDIPQPADLTIQALKLERAGSNG